VELRIDIPFPKRIRGGLKEKGTFFIDSGSSVNFSFSIVDIFAFIIKESVGILRPGNLLDFNTKDGLEMWRREKEILRRGLRLHL